MSGTRDLPGEVAAWLAEHPESVTEEIAAGVRARPKAVRQILTGDPRFTRVSPSLTGRKHNARVWTLARVPVPRNGTGRDDQTAAEAADHPSAAVAESSEAPVLPAVGEPGWARRRLEALIVEAERMRQ